MEKMQGPTRMKAEQVWMTYTVVAAVAAADDDDDNDEEWKGTDYRNRYENTLQK